MGPLTLRMGVVVALTAIAAAALFGAGVMVGSALDDSKTAPAGYQADASASVGTTPGVNRDTVRDANGRKSPSGRPRTDVREQSSKDHITPAAPIEERLNRSLLLARQAYLDEAAVTRYQKALENEVAYGFCKAGSSGRYRCTVVELLPQVDPRKQKKECLLLAVNRVQRRACAKPPDLSRSQDPVDFDVSLHSDGCWVAVRPSKIDPTESAKLQGCLSSN